MDNDDITSIQALVAQHSRNGIVITDADERIRWVNNGFSRLTGYSAQEAIGQIPGRLLQGPDSDPEVRAHMRACIDARRRFDAKILNYHKDGTAYMIEISADPVFDAAGEFNGFVAIQYDISHREKIRQHRDLETKRLLTLLQSMDGGILVEDSAGIIQTSNERLQQMFDLSPEYLTGKSGSDLLTAIAPHFRNPETFLAQSHAIQQAKQRQTGEMLELTNGDWLERDFLPITSGGQRQGALWHYHEATEKVRTVKILDAVARAGQAILKKRMEAGAYEDALAILGDAVEPDRVYIFKCHPHPSRGIPACSQIAEWVADGVTPQRDLPDLQNVAWEDYSTRWQKELSAGRCLVGAVAEFPANERHLLDLQEIQSILIVPIFSRESLWGFMGFDHCKQARKWLPAEVSLLMSAASSIGLRIAQQEDEDRLHQAMETANAANVAKSRFLSTMSHEIRTPLNSILGYTQLLRRSDHLQARERSQIETIHRSGKHLLTLINDILDISKIESGRVNLNASEFVLQDCAIEIVEMLQARAEAKGIKLYWLIVDDNGNPMEADQAVFVRADIKALRQVLVNLVGNAVKFTSKGEVRMEIRVPKPRKDSTPITFRIVDTGMGIPDDARQNLFTAFTQVHKNYDTEKGTGLGLAIVKGMVDLMQGTIEVDSEEGVGSCFAFTIPMPCQFGERHRTPIAPVAESDILTHFKGYSGPKRTILIVDDVSENRALLRDLLHPFGFATMEATNGREALAMLESNSFDLVMTDILMPFMDGRAFAKHAKQNPKTRSIPIIGVTASVIRDQRATNPLDQHFVCFLNKPIDTNATLAAIGETLHLQWVTEPRTSPVTTSAQPDTAPPASPPRLGENELRPIYNMARLGDIDALQNALMQHRQNYPQVVDPMLDLLDQYAINAVCKRLEALIQKAVS